MIVAYGASPDGIRVSDPNTPGDTARVVRYANGSFQPYYSGENSAEMKTGKDAVFTRFRYFGVYKYLGKERIERSWAKFQDGTIGDGDYPGYALKMVDNAGNVVPVADGYRTSNNAIELGYTIAGEDRPAWVYGPDGNKLASIVGGTKFLKFPLHQGENKMGVGIYGRGAKNDEWVDFKRISVFGDFSLEKPSVVIIEPQAGAVFTSGTALTVAVSATSKNGGIARVELFNGAEKIAETTTSPFSFELSNLAAANYQLVARVTDNAGATGDSPPVAVSVKPGPESTFYLTFPLANRTATTAKINTVFDHTAAIAYGSDGAITAFTGESGQTQYGKDFGATINGVALYGFKNSAGSAFSITGGGNYAGAGKPEYLYYDGHPGYDFRTTDQSSDGKINVLAAATGTAYWVSPSNYNTMYIDHENGYFTYYLHLFERKVAGGSKVTQGQPIAIAGEAGSPGAPHLHFEVRYYGVPVDPYGWTGTAQDPYTRAKNINLWNTPLAPSLPSVPTNVTATGFDGRVTLRWALVPGADAYNIYFSTSPGVNKTTGTLLSLKQAPFDHLELTNDLPYYYSVSAVNAAGESALSSEKTATPRADNPGTIPLGTTVSGANQNLQVILTRLPADFISVVSLADNQTGETIYLVKSGSLSFPNYRKIVLANEDLAIRQILPFSGLSFSRRPPPGARIEVFDPDSQASLVATTTPGGSLIPIALGKTLSGLTQNVQVILSAVPTGFNTTVSLIDRRNREEFYLVKSPALSYPNFQRLFLGAADSIIREVEPFDTLYFSTSPPAGARIEVRDGDRGIVVASIAIPGESQSVVSLGTTVANANQSMQVRITNVAADFVTSTSVIDDRTGESVQLSKSAALSYPNFQRLVLGVTDLSLRMIRSFNSLSFTTAIPSGARVEVFDPESNLAIVGVNIP